MVGFCIVCGERLVHKSAEYTAASLALLHCPDLMAEQGTHKVVVSKGEGGVVYELCYSHWLNPLGRYNGITCLKDEIGKGHLGHSHTATSCQTRVRGEARNCGTSLKRTAFVTTLPNLSSRALRGSPARDISWRRTERAAGSKNWHWQSD